MEKMISKCGIICTECEAYKATATDSDELRKKTAETWSKMFGVNIPYETVNCMGCQQPEEGVLFSHCKECKIRSCATDKGHTTCADCPDYGCILVSEIWKHDVNIKNNLDELRG